MSPKPIPVHIIMVLDRSYSIQSYGLTEPLVKGVNDFIDEQRSKPGKCRLTLVDFTTDDRPRAPRTHGLIGTRGLIGPSSEEASRLKYTVRHSAVDIRRVPHLTLAEFVPESGTPLFEAESRAITDGMAREQARARAGKAKEAVLFVTFTDGEENSSLGQYIQSLPRLKAEREEAGWAMLYNGLGHDAYTQAQMSGVHVANTSSVAASAAGMGSVMRSANAVATSYRTAAFAGDTATLNAATADVYGALEVEKPEDDPTWAAATK